MSAGRHSHKKIGICVSSLKGLSVTDVVLRLNSYIQGKGLQKEVLHNLHHVLGEGLTSPLVEKKCVWALAILGDAQGLSSVLEVGISYNEDTKTFSSQDSVDPSLVFKNSLLNGGRGRNLVHEYDPEGKKPWEQVWNELPYSEKVHFSTASAMDVYSQSRRGVPSKTSGN